MQNVRRAAALVAFAAALFAAPLASNADVTIRQGDRIVFTGDSWSWFHDTLGAPYRWATSAYFIDPINAAFVARAPVAGVGSGVVAQGTGTVGVPAAPAVTAIEPHWTGRPGAKVSDFDATWAMETGPPAIVFWLIGENDVTVTAPATFEATWRTRYASMVALLPASTQIVCVTVGLYSERWDDGPVWHDARLPAINARVISAAADVGCALIDLSTDILGYEAAHNPSKLTDGVIGTADWLHLTSTLPGAPTPAPLPTGQQIAGGFMLGHVTVVP